MESEGLQSLGLALILLLGVIGCLALIAFSSPNPREVLLLSVVLTILSVLSSWIISGHYSEKSFNRSQRLFAHKAAEKVTNLSHELERLSLMLQEELRADDYESTDAALLARNLKIESAIHIIATLKSVNDGSLSDWQGVIGEEISARLQDQEEREETLRDLAERLDSLAHAGAAEGISALAQVGATDSPADEHAHEVQRDLAGLRDDMRALAAQVSGVPLRQMRGPRAAKTKLVVAGTCPACHSEVSYRRKAKPTSVKHVTCPECRANLYSQAVGDGFELKLRLPIEETVTCPICAAVAQVNLDPVPGAEMNFVCPTCQTTLKIIRRQSEVLARAVPAPGKQPPTPHMTPELLQKVLEAMGPQPWPPGRSRAVAQQLSLQPWVVSEAVKQLILRGVFRPQVNGRLYVPGEATEVPPSEDLGAR